MPTIYNLKLPRIILKQRAPKIDIVPDTICPKFNDLLSMFWQIFVCSAKSAKDNNKKTAYNYLISLKKSATILVCLLLHCTACLPAMLQCSITFMCYPSWAINIQLNTTSCV